MSPLARPAFRWSALIGLWSLVVAVLWLLAVQAFLLALNPFCSLQRPSLGPVSVVAVDPNPDSQLTDFVTVRREGGEKILNLTKAEAALLRPEDSVWILEAWYADGLRPTAFRATPLRLLLEYPALLLLPAAFGLWRVRRARQVAEAAPPPPIRRTFTDDFHLRAQRFAKPPAAPPPAAEAPPADPQP